MAFDYLNNNVRLNGTPEKRTQNGLNKIFQPIQRKMMAKILGFLDKI